MKVRGLDSQWRRASVFCNTTQTIRYRNVRSIFFVVSLIQNLKKSILNLQLNMMADRELKKNQLQAHDGSIPPSYLSCSRAFLNKKVCILVQIDSMHWNCQHLQPCWLPISLHGYCHGWLCGACALARMWWYDGLCLKIFLRTNQIRENTSSNEQVPGDRCNQQITEVMLK